MAKVLVSPAARFDADSIRTYLTAEAGRRTADRVVAEFEAFVETLVVHPERGAPCPSLGRGVRIGVLHPYLVVYGYRSDADEVTVLRFVDGRRRLSRRLLRP